MPASRDQFLQANRRFWETVTAFHVDSPHYRTQRAKLLRGQPALDPLVVAQVGDLSGQAVLQPLCHLGYDALSLRLLGARQVAGWDGNPQATAHANDLAGELGLSGCRFWPVDLPDTAKGGRRYDLVLVTFGSLCWIPDLKPWFTALARVIKRGGRILIADFHPLLFCFDFLQSRKTIHAYSSATGRPLRINRIGSYAAPRQGGRTVSYNWNHSIGDIMNSLLGAGFKIDRFSEHDSLPETNSFPGLKRGRKRRWFAQPPFEGLPLMFTLQASRS